MQCTLRVHACCLLYCFIAHMGDAAANRAAALPAVVLFAAAALPAVALFAAASPM